MAENIKTVGIIIPIMNESGNVVPMVERITEVFKSSFMINYVPHILFVDDGSTDDTLAVLRKCSKNYKEVHYLSLSRNFGHQNALKAGLDFIPGDCVISMDGDLQHPPEFIPKLITSWENGFLIVNTIRTENNTPFLKRLSSKLFYGIINYLGEVNVVSGGADFRLLDRKIVDVLADFSEWPLFFRGIVPWLGFKTEYLSYLPDIRTWGKTKYSYRKMFAFSLNGITSFSVKPLRIATILGLIISMAAVLFAMYALGIKFFTTRALGGWTSLTVLVSFLGGLQLLMLGILGEYFGKLFMAQKSRPLYLIQEKDYE